MSERVFKVAKGQTLIKRVIQKTIIETAQIGEQSHFAFLKSSFCDLQSLIKSSFHQGCQWEFWFKQV